MVLLHWFIWIKWKLPVPNKPTRNQWKCFLYYTKVVWEVSSFATFCFRCCSHCWAIAVVLICSWFCFFKPNTNTSRITKMLNHCLVWCIIAPLLLFYLTLKVHQGISFFKTILGGIGFYNAPLLPVHFVIFALCIVMNVNYSFLNVVTVINYWIWVKILCSVRDVKRTNNQIV